VLPLPSGQGESGLRMALPASQLAPSRARSFVRAVITQRALATSSPGPPAERLADDAALVVGELTTNALIHAGTPMDVICEVERAPGADGVMTGVRIEVVDRQPTGAVPGGPDGRGGGRGLGLQIVTMLSDSWGVTYRHTGKSVWCRLTTSASDHAPTLVGPLNPALYRQLEATEVAQPHARVEYRGPTRRTDRRGTFLAEAGELLSGVLDENMVAALASQLMVPRLADWCAVWLRTEAGAMRLASVWHANERRIAPLRRDLEPEPPPCEAWSAGLPWPWPESLGGESLAGVLAGEDAEGDAGEAAGGRGGEGGAGDGGAGAGGGRGGRDGAGSGVGARSAGRTDPPVADAPTDAGGTETARARTARARTAGINTAGIPGTGGAARADADTGVTAEAATDSADTADGEGGGSALAFSLTSGGVCQGILLIGRAAPAEITDWVVRTVQDVARRVAQAVVIARQYTRQTSISRAVQRRQLPSSLGSLPGVESAIVYEPHASGQTVGGDFYDLFPTGDGRWCFLLGDVQGKDAEAMSVTGLTRHMVRLLARQGNGVEAVLGWLNSVMAEDAAEAASAAGEGARPRFLSMVYGELTPDPQAGGAQCALASAGHPLPLRMSADGRVHGVVRSQLLLGIDENADFTSDSFHLAPGETLLCVTDGVTERRDGRRQLDDDDGLARIFRDCVGMGAMAVAERIRQATHDFGPEPVEDDLAIVVLHAVGTSGT
jgi:serine phosphatase RsbU (regulator of sigma subunit)/anti-sigma regulatory factor (Ser/Thr protein kinase)